MSEVIKLICGVCFAVVAACIAASALLLTVNLAWKLFS